MVLAPEPTSVLGYELGDVIGEGGQGRVRLAVNARNEVAAVKLIRKFTAAGEPVNLQNLRKEVKIHQAVAHENIIQLFATGEDDGHVYIAMEYAASGELFDLIEPDVGIDEELAHLYFQQLVSGMEYLHGMGVSHRDLKPENMLLDNRGNLKISDFGLATVFKFKGVTRVLTTPCGTPPYVAPEIHHMKYNGDSVDIWSAGIILYVLLAGNTPWAEPTPNDEEFRLYLKAFPDGLDYLPWSTLSREVFELLCGLLTVDPKSRFTTAQIRSNPWFSKPNKLLTDGQCNNTADLAKRLKANLKITSAEMLESSQGLVFAFSQPMDMRIDGDAPEMLDFPRRRIGALGSFSQPARLAKSESQSPVVGRITGNYHKHTVNLFPTDRITRFYSTEDPAAIFKRITEALESFLVPFKVHQKLLKIAFSTVDRRKCQLHGEVSIQRATDEYYIVLFRKSKVSSSCITDWDRGV
ncbi:Chk1 protein kinase [Polyrhizophydium stewartii]|uniref:non-specific serine/threonine protein kinase n=1 Tax=Polyrhizophydium stewartii TaxID=2732419 RepID=A0ABR4NAY6_9FUNG